jgi:hypothetical protein
MADLILTTFDWVPEAPRALLRIQGRDDQQGAAPRTPTCQPFVRTAPSLPDTECSFSFARIVKAVASNAMNHAATQTSPSSSKRSL